MPNEPSDRIIRYAKAGDRITLEMHQEDYENILMLCGYYAGQIDIPEEYRTRA